MAMDKAQLARPWASFSQAVDHGPGKGLGAKKWLETCGGNNDWDTR